MYVPARTAYHGTAPRIWGDAAGWVNMQANADDILLLAKPEDELQQMHTDLRVACAK